MRRGKMGVGWLSVQIRRSSVPCSALSFRSLMPRPFICCFFSLVIFVFALFPTNLWAQNDNETSNPSLTASLDRGSARIGSVVTLILNYRLPEDAGFFDIPQIGGLEELTQVDREIGLNQIKIKLLVDHLGSWKTGPLSLGYLDKDGETQVLRTDPVTLTVLSNLGEKPEEAELRAIQGIIPTKRSWLKRLPWVGAGIALVLMALAFFWWRRTRCHREVLAAMDPPHIRAVKEITELEGQNLFETGHAKAFYFRFSEILRRYLEGIRGFPAAEFTTEEIAHYIKSEPDRRLLPLLRQADLVKFADTVPTPASKAEAVKAALNFIHETSPTDETVNSSSGSQKRTVP